MNVPVECRDWETASGFANGREHLEAVLSGDELGFVLPDAGRDPAEVVQQFGPVLAAHHYVLPERDLMLAHGYAKSPTPPDSDRPVKIKKITRTEGVHIDGRPRPSGLAVMVINMWLGWEGEADAQILETSQEFAGTGAFKLPKNTDTLLDEGKVDTSVLEPLLYEARLKAGHLAVFRTAGRRPGAHRFRSTSLPRASIIIHAFSDSMFQDRK